MTALSQRRLRLFLIPLLCLSAVARAQSGSGSVLMSGGVSEIVALSISPSAESSRSGVSVTSTRNADRSLTVTVSGSTRGLMEIRIPVQIRSNTGYRLFAAAKAGGANLSSLFVFRARPTGILVAPGAAEAVSVAPMFDGRDSADRLMPAGSFGRQNFSAPFELLSGPRVSTGGLPMSPHNALEVTLSVAVETRADNQVWTIELQLSAEPGGGTRNVQREMKDVRVGSVLTPADVRRKTSL